MMTIATGGISNGVTKYIAQYQNYPKKLNLFLSSSFLITVSLSIVTSIILVIFANYFSTKIFFSTSYSSIIVIFGFTIIFYSLNNLILSILNGFKEYKKIVIINMITSVFGAFFTILLIYTFKLWGALIAAVTFQSISFFFSYSILRKATWMKPNISFFNFSRLAGKKYFNYTLMTIVAAILAPISQMLIRGHIINHLSPFHAGLWEGMSRLSGAYLLVITTTLSVYYLPKLSEISSNLEIKNEIYSALKFLIPFLFIFFILIFILKEQIILLLFSKSFEGMSFLFKFQLIGDFFKIISWLFAFIMVAKSMTKLYIITEILFSSTYLIISYFLFKNNGILGLSIAYMLNYILYLLYLLFIFRRFFFKKYNSSNL